MGNKFGTLRRIQSRASLGNRMRVFMDPSLRRQGGGQCRVKRKEKANLAKELSNGLVAGI